MKTFKIEVTRVVEYIEHATVEVDAISLEEAKANAILEIEEGLSDPEWDEDIFPKVKYEAYEYDYD